MTHSPTGRGLPWVLLLAVLLLGIATAPAQAADLTLTMRLAEAEWHVIRQDVLPPFERACGCRVRAIDVPPEALTQRLKAMRAAGRVEIDLFAQDNMRLQELVDAGLVQPLDAEEAALDPAILPALAAAGILDGRRYFLPFRPNVQIAYYNAKKFDAYGLSPPRTWDALLAAARTFKEKEGIGRVLFQGVGGAPTVTQLYEWIVSAGATRSTSPILAPWRRSGSCANWRRCCPRIRGAPNGTRPMMRWRRSRPTWPRTGPSASRSSSATTARGRSGPTAAGPARRGRPT